MCDALVIAQFEGRLVELGCPSRRRRDKVRELAEHYQDIASAAKEEGLPETEAVRQAAARLGNTVSLAENWVELLRQSSWWGRHPIIGFCVLPLLAFLPAWMLCAASGWGMVWLAGRLLGPAYDFDPNLLNTFGNDSQAFNSFADPANIALTSASAVLITVVFCWLAHRAASGLKWMLVTCVFSGLASLMLYSVISPHNFTLGFYIGYPTSHWLYAIIPLVWAVAIFFRQQQMENRLA